ncbi:MAG: mechanosensitive ion channel domain-containing protein, partial [Flavobacteriales bacterium]
MLERLSAYFERIGVATTASSNYAIASLIVAAFVFAFLLNQIFKRISIGVFHRLAKRTTSDFDDILLEKRVPHNLANLITLLFLLWVLLSFFQSNEAIQWTVKVVEALLTFNFIIILRGILNSFKVILSRVPLLKDKPIDSYVQVLMIFLWFIGSIIVLSILTGKSVGTFLTALGALSAVLLLIFKDTILGFVASIQISVNDTVRIGDWITMKNMGADGDVIAINLSSVQVQNFDKTITTIPTYKLLSDPFINWRGMSESQGRRLKRVLYIQAATVRFLSDEELKELQKV